MSNKLSRRRILQVGTTGTALAIAGCSSSGDDDTDETVENTGDNGAEETTVSESGEATVTVNVDLTDEQMDEIDAEMEERQEEIQEQVDEGEMEEEESQMALQQAQMEIQQEFIADSAAAVEAAVDGTDGLTLSESEPEMGMLLVEGDAEALIGLLAEEEVLGLLSETEFEDQLEQQQQQEEEQQVP